MANHTNEQLETRSHVQRAPAVPPQSDDPRVIRAHIEQTREQMGHTIDQIQHRLSPEHLRRQAEETVKDATIGKVEEMTMQAEREVKSWRRRVVHTVKENPIPAALIGIGLGWMLASDDTPYEREYTTPYREHYYPYSDSYRRGPTEETTRLREGREWVDERKTRAQTRAQDVADTAQDRAASAAHSMRESVDETTDRARREAANVRERVQETTHEAQMQARETAAHLETRTRRQVRRGKRTFWETMEENPLAIGAAALAAGALVGLAIPSTEAEDRWVGEKRDELVDEAKARARDVAEDAQIVAKEAKDAAVDTAKKEAEKRDLAQSQNHEQVSQS